MDKTSTIYQLLEAQNLDNTDKSCLVDLKGRSLSYGNLFNQINYIVEQLHQLGLNKEDKIAIALPNGVNMAVTFLGVASTGICCPLNPHYRGPEFEFYLSDLNAKALITQEGIAPAAIAIAEKLNIQVIKLTPSPHQPGIFTLEGNQNNPQTPAQSNYKEQGIPSPADIALILHTSGTTFRPKQVPLTQLNLCTSAHNISSFLGLNAADRCLNLMPMFHVHGLVITLLSSILVAAEVVCMQEFKINQFWLWLDQFQPTWYSGVSTLHLSILQAAPKHLDVIQNHRLRFIRTSSAPIPPQAILDLEALFNVPVIQGYGMTEASPQMAINPLPPGQRKPESVGIACGVKISILDEQNRFLPPYEVGEVVISNVHFDGYLGDPAITEAAFYDGWFRTGDLGYLDEEGYLFLKGRKKEIINRGGEKIMPLEVDYVALKLPEIYQAVTFAVPHPVLGEDAVMAVVLHEGKTISPQAIRAFLFQNLVDFKVPTRVIVVDEIPKGATKKLQRIGLAEKLAAQLQVLAVAPTTAFETKLATLWQQVLDLTTVGINDNFFALGGYSLLAADLVVLIEEEFGISLGIGIIFEYPTIAELAAVLDSPKTIELNQAYSLIPIQAQGDRPILFGVHHIYFKDLAENLGPDQPIYALRYGIGEPLDTVIELPPIKELANHYIEQMKSLQPEGPYYLMGLSFGGIVAYEMAQQLLAQGQQVGILALFDSHIIPGYLSPRPWPQRIKILGQLGLKELWRRLLSKLERWNIQQMVKQLRTDKTSALAYSPHIHNAEVNRQLIDLYQPQSYPEEVILFQAKDDIYVNHITRLAVTEWPAYAKKLKVYEIPGNHTGILDEPNVQYLAAHLKAEIDQTLAAQTQQENSTDLITQ